MVNKYFEGVVYAPVEKDIVDDELISGSINGSQGLVYKVSKKERKFY